ncbi:MAG: nucleoside monophosphate kinase, partial [Pseudomonadota bacterium]
MFNLILLGAPGSGKGTQSKLLINKLGFLQISTGDILRKEVADNSDLGKMANKIMQSGNLVPDDIMIDMMRNHISQIDYSKGLIFDGFPRNIEQAKHLDQLLAEYDACVNKVILLDIPTQMLVDRIIHRYTCKNCGAIYNKKFKIEKIAGVCDGCGGKEFIQRDDDNAETIKNRIDIFNNLTAMLKTY